MLFRSGESVRTAGGREIAEVFSRNLSSESGAEKGRRYRSGPAFFIGQTRYAKKRNVDFKELGEDGFAFHPDAENLIIAGGIGKGTLYGVYGLLELLGFRMYTSTSLDIPNVRSIRLPKNALVVVPRMQYRTTFYRDTRDPEYTNWHGLSSRDDWGFVRPHI